MATGQFVEVPYPTVRPHIPQPKSPTLHHWNIYPMPQSDKVPLGLTQSQPQKIYLRPEKIGQFTLLGTSTCSHCENRSTTPDSSDPLGDGHTKTNYREMLMGTTLPHL